jgi:hypothetical protein
MNALGKLVTAAYRARASLAQALYGCPIQSNAAADELRRDGVLVLPAALPPASLEAIASLNDGRFDYERRGDIVYSPDGVKLQEASETTPEQFARYYFLHIKNYGTKLDVYDHVDAIIRPILSAYYRSNYYYREMDCYRSQPVGSAFSGSYAWHRDNYPPGSLKVIGYLTDVLAVDDGPLVVAAGSQRGFQPELGKVGPRVPREDVEGRLELRACLGKKGTLVLFNNNAVHRAANPLRGYREVFNALILPRIVGGRQDVAGTNLDDGNGFWKRYTR